MMVLLLALVAAALSFALTAALRRYALARNLMDVPNERSSHSIPTPRGGGLSVVFAFSLTVLLLAVAGRESWAGIVALLGSGIFVALLGFLDDHGHIRAGWRLLGHFLAAIWAIAWLGGPPQLFVWDTALNEGLITWILAILYLVWLLNLYNFMDGIDGLAGIEAVTVCCSAAVLLAVMSPGEDGWVLPAFLACAALGFLVWNFPPAKIFMGDAGSGFLGITIGILSLLGAQAAPSMFWAWVILLGVFVVDATVTLFRRLLRGLRPHEAHRSHSYQYASRRLRAHRPVSLTVGAINVFWLLPWAAAAALGWVDGVVGVVCAYLPLIWLAFRLKAGAPDLQEV